MTVIDEIAAERRRQVEADYVASIFARAEAARQKAQRKFPQPNFVALKVAEEAGEVVRAAVHYSEGRLQWAELEAEAVQTIAMVMRLLIEGDQRNGVHPPSRLAEIERIDRAATRQGE